MWSVAVTKGRSEFSVAAALREATLDVFLPHIKEKTRILVPTRGRAVYKAQVREVPRWPRYLFVRTPTDEARNLALSTRDVRDLVHFGAEPAYVSDATVDQLREGCDANGRLLKHSSLYNVGDILRFIAPSPFAGRRGEVARLDDESVGLLVAGRFVTTRYNEVAPIA